MLDLQGESFLLKDSGPGTQRSMVSGALRNLDPTTKAKVYVADGAFKVAPELWTQVYTIHAHQDGFYMQLLFCLLPNKQVVHLQTHVAHGPESGSRLPNSPHWLPTSKPARGTPLKQAFGPRKSRAVASPT